MADTATEEVTTGSVLQGMLTENTGRHFLDSGDAYGRSWEKNQGRVFASEQPFTVSWKYGIDVTASVYHFLEDRLSYEQAGDEAWLAWGNAREDEAWLQSAQEWVALIGGKGIYGDGEPVVVNTYNGEDLLSQTIQYVYFTLDDDAALPRPEKKASTDPRWGRKTLSGGTYVLLQIHGGADVRGGYTKPRLFSLYDHDETAILDNARATIHCSADRDHYWSTDDTCNWYADGSTAATQLDAYDRVEVDFTDATPQEDNSPENDALAYSTDAELRVGKLVIDTDEDTAYCPICGTGTLEVGP